MAFTHEGKLVNAESLRRDLEEAGTIFQTNLDIEVIANLIARNIDSGFEEALKKTVGMVKGAYALLMMTEEKLVAVRDPLGIRPLALGKLDDSFVVASENCAFDTIGAEFIRDVKPGEILIIDKDADFHTNIIPWNLLFVSLSSFILPEQQHY